MEKTAQNQHLLAKNNNQKSHVCKYFLWMLMTNN